MEELRCNKCKEEKLSDPNACDACIQMHVEYAQLMDKESPITNIQVCASYYASTNGLIQLPLYKKWEDVETHYIKYDVLHYKMKDEDTWREASIDGPLETGDTKTPIAYSIYSEDYETEYVAADSE